MCSVAGLLSLFGSRECPIRNNRGYHLNLSKVSGFQSSDPPIIYFPSHGHRHKIKNKEQITKTAFMHTALVDSCKHPGRRTVAGPGPPSLLEHPCR